MSELYKSLADIAKGNNVPSNILNQNPNIASTIESAISNIQSNIQTGIDQRMIYGIDSVNASITDINNPAITGAVGDTLESAIKSTLKETIDSTIETTLDSNQQIVSIIDDVVSSYQYYRYVIILIFVFMVVAIICSCVSIGTTAYTNYAYLTTDTTNKPVRIINSPEYSMYKYTYQTVCNYSVMQEVEELIYQTYDSLKSSIKSIVLLDIRVSEKSMKVRHSLLENIARDCWLSASEPSVFSLLRKHNTSKLIVDMFVNYDDYATLMSILSTRGVDVLSLAYSVGRLTVVFEFKIYKNSNDGEYLNLVNGAKRNPDTIRNNVIYPAIDVKLIGNSDRIIRVPNHLNIKINDMKKKPYMFYYWDSEDLINLITPYAYIKICHESIIKHCKNSFELVKLDKSNIYMYLPELKTYDSILSKLSTAHKVDVYRVFLMYRYGGLYIESDVLVMRNPIGLMAHLKNVEYIGFGCTGHKCFKDGYMRPSNWIVGSRKGSYLFRDIRQFIIDNLLDSEFPNHNQGSIWKKNNLSTNMSNILFGKQLIWYTLDHFTSIDFDAIGKNISESNSVSGSDFETESEYVTESESESASASKSKNQAVHQIIDDIDPKKYSYHHVGSDILGTRDSKGRMVTPRQLFSSKLIEYADESKLMFIILNPEFDDAVNKEMSAMTKDALIKSNTEIGRFVRRSMNLSF